jgi:hypothetical protein
VSSYSFDHYKRELATDLTLDDLHRFTECFLAKHRRQLQRQDRFLEFLVPDVLEPFGLPPRYRAATFDRELAIERSDADFLALGHPFVDAMLRYVGSYDFGGLTAARRIASSDLAGLSGHLFVFIVRQRITREDADECLFRFEPVFVTTAGEINSQAAAVAVTQTAVEPRQASGRPPDSAAAFQVARQHLEKGTGIWDWADDVEFLGLSWVEFA